MQAQYLGPVEVNGQMMNLFSFNDFMDGMKEGAKIATNGLNMVDNTWKQVHPESYNQYGGSGI